MTDNEMATHVTKVGGGHPSKNAVGAWRKIFAQDPAWFPGKTQEERAKPGPAKLLTAQKANAIASCAMAIKRSGLEPSVARVRERCPGATSNPDTGLPFTDKYILDVFRGKCHDDGSTQTWQRTTPLQKTALPEFLIEKRRTWAAGLLRAGATPGWYHRHCIWVDPCHNILTTSRRQVFDQAQASYGKAKRWMSCDQRVYSRNTRSSPYGGKQQQFGDRKVWWFIVLTRGKVHIEVMGNEWRQTGAGMAEFVERLPTVLTRMVGGSEAWPRVVFSDRGPGFYQSSTGHVTHAYKAALQKHGFRTFAGDDASAQPPDVPDVLLHETAVAWIRNFLRKHPFSRAGSLDDQEAQLHAVFSQCQDHINTTYDVRGLTNGFPARLEKLVHDTEGDRLRT